MTRGDVFELRLRGGTGHEQSGRRFGVVVQSDAMNRLSTVLVAPTSRSARAAKFRPEIEIDGQPTRVLAEQMSVVDPSRLGNLVGHLTPQEQWGVDLALSLVLGLG